MTHGGRPGHRAGVLSKLAAGFALALVGALVAARTGAQEVDPRKPALFVRGAPRGASPMARVDAQRRARAPDALPSGALVVTWRRPLGLTLDQPALALENGRLAVVASRGDVVLLDAAGEELAHATVAAGAAGPAAATSDGTVAFATSAGDAVGVGADGRVRYVTRVLGDRSPHGAPLSLDDGGVLLATPGELVMLDAGGNVRTRAPLAEPPGAPLLSAGDDVLVVSVTGTVFAYAPGGVPRRVGSFGGPVDGGAALLEGRVLVGVVGGELVDVDLARGGVRTTRATAVEGVLLGPVAAYPKGGPRAVALLHLTATRTSVLAIDAAGTELVRAAVGASAGATTTTFPDGGAPPLVVTPHVGPVTDGHGAIAFATPDGVVGVVRSDGQVAALAPAPCSRVGRSAGVSGLTPAGDGAFLVSCEAGLVARVEAADVGRAPGKGPGSRL